MPRQATDPILSMAGRIGAETSWANTSDRTARTEPGRRRFEERFAREDEDFLGPVREHLIQPRIDALITAVLALPMSTSA